MPPIRDYTRLAGEILEALGEENIINAAHCATRLRLVLKRSPSPEITAKISSMPGVIQVMEKGGQYQIVIGPHVDEVYRALTDRIQLEKSEDLPTSQGIGARIIAAMSAVFAPFVYILAAAGLIQGALILLSLMIPSFVETGTYQVLSFISWTPFTFLPVLIAVTASRHFKCNIYIAMWCCLALVNSSWAEMAGQIAAGETIRFLVFPLSQTTYTSSVLPPLFLVLVLSYLEHALDRILPDILKPIGIPLLCALIMVPSAFLIIGPLSDILANAIAVGYTWLSNTIPILAALIVGGFWQIIVIFGVHWGVTPMVLANLANYGQDSFQAFQTCAVIAQAAACFGVFLKSRDKEIRSVAASAGVTGIFGITEPAIYGVTLRLKKPFIAGCIGGAAGAVVAALGRAHYYVYAGLPGILTIINSIDTTGTNPGSFFWELMGCLVTVVVTILLIQVIDLEDETQNASAGIPSQTFEEPKSSLQSMRDMQNPEAPASAVITESTASESKPDLTNTTAASSPDPTDSEASSMQPQPGNKPLYLYSPMYGTVHPLSDVPDPTFAEGLLGDGIAILPETGKLYSPVDGTIVSVFPTKHAVTLRTPDGLDLLIHVGIDTVSLNGTYFTSHVNDGDPVKKGDLILEFDLDQIRKEYNTITPILIVNSHDLGPIRHLKTLEPTRAGEPLLQIAPKPCPTPT